MTDQLNPVNPYSFLRELFESDPFNAVRIANIWGEVHSNPEKYQVAWEIAQLQTLYPVCVRCTWPVVGEDRHFVCERELRGLDVEPDEDLAASAVVSDLSEDDLLALYDDFYGLDDVPLDDDDDEIEFAIPGVNCCSVCGDPGCKASFH